MLSNFGIAVLAAVSFSFVSSTSSRALAADAPNALHCPISNERDSNGTPLHLVRLDTEETSETRALCAPAYVPETGSEGLEEPDFRKHQKFEDGKPVFDLANALSFWDKYPNAKPITSGATQGKPKVEDEGFQKLRAYFESLRKTNQLQEMFPGWTQAQIDMLYNEFGIIYHDNLTTSYFLNNPSLGLDEVNPVARFFGVRTDNPNASGLPLLTSGLVMGAAAFAILWNPKMSQGTRTTILTVITILHGLVVFNNQVLIAQRGGNYLPNGYPRVSPAFTVLTLRF